MIPVKIASLMEIITTHLEADFDGIASMVAAHKLYPEAHLVLPGGVQSRERAYLANHSIPLASITDLPLTDITRVILVDTDHQDRLGLLEKIIEDTISFHPYLGSPSPGTNKSSGHARRVSQGGTGWSKHHITGRSS